MVRAPHDSEGDEAPQPAPERKFQLPHEAQALLELFSACDGNKHLMEALLHWVAVREGRWVSREEWRALQEKVHQLEETRVSRDELAGQVRQEVREELKWWLFAIAGIFSALLGLLWFFWEKIHPLLGNANKIPF